MEIYKVKAFLRFARAEAISDERLAEAVERANAGFDDAAVTKMIDSGAWSRVETDKDKT